MTQKIFMTVLIVMMITLSGCVMNTGNFCDVYLPVPTLDGGRKEQRDNIDKNNAYHMERCK